MPNAAEVALGVVVREDTSDIGEIGEGMKEEEEEPWVATGGGIGVEFENLNEVNPVLI